MKTINFFLSLKESNPKCFYFLILCFTYLIINITPSLISSYQPDSSTYKDFDMTRTSIYPYVIDILEKFNIDLFFFQKLLLSSSIVFLMYSLVIRNVNSYLIILFFFGLTLNLFYTSFSKTILTESIFFSFINISFAIFVLGKYKNFLLNFILGISIGFIITIKSIGFSIGISLTIVLLIYFVKEKLYKNIFVILLSLFLVVCLENFLFFKNHDQRKSVLPIAIVGKVFFLSGNDSFNIENFPEKFIDIIDESKSSFKPVSLFLKKINNPILRADLTADYEVVAQYQFLKFKIPVEKKFNERNIFEHSYELLIPLLKYNFKEYFILSCTHYLGMWSTNSKEIFLKKYLEKNLIKQPLEQEFQNASGGIKKINSKLLIYVQLLFLALFLCFTLLTFYSIYLIFKKKFFENIHIITLIVTSQIYLVLTSFANVATIRYLMPIYPLILLSLIFFISSLKKD